VTAAFENIIAHWNFFGEFFLAGIFWGIFSVRNIISVEALKFFWFGGCPRTSITKGQDRKGGGWAGALDRGTIKKRAKHMSGKVSFATGKRFE